MHNQPKYRGLRGTAFFTDGGSARPLVEGTVARGTLQDDAVFFTGKAGTATVKELPFPVDDAVLNRGQERFNIYCTPCHDTTGSGKGMVVQRGFKAPPSFHDERLRNAGVRAAHLGFYLAIGAVAIWIPAWFVTHDGWLLLGAIAASVVVSNLFIVVHDTIHRPGSHRLVEAQPWFRFLDRHHYVHHVALGANLNFLLPLADLLFGTLRTRLTDEELAAFGSLEQAKAQPAPTPARLSRRS
jgi:hypothetical protein